MKIIWDVEFAVFCLHKLIDNFSCWPYIDIRVYVTSMHFRRNCFKKGSMCSKAHCATQQATKNIRSKHKKTTLYAAHSSTKWKLPQQWILEKKLSISFPKSRSQDWRQANIKTINAGSGLFRIAAPFMCFPFARSLPLWRSSRLHSRHQGPEFHLASVFCCSSSR